MKALIAGTGAVFALVLLLATAEVDAQGEKDKAKYSIADVMKRAMKGGLYKKVVDGKATAEEKDELIDLFEALHVSLPPKGSPESWKEKTKSLLDAARNTKADPQAAAALGKLANCMACHKEYKK